MLWGSECTKGARKHVGKTDPRSGWEPMKEKGSDFFCMKERNVKKLLFQMTCNQSESSSIVKIDPAESRISSYAC